MDVGMITETGSTLLFVICAFDSEPFITLNEFIFGRIAIDSTFMEEGFIYVFSKKAKCSRFTVFPVFG